MQPYFDPTRKRTSKIKWKTTSKKMTKNEDDLNKKSKMKTTSKNEDDLKKKMKTTLIYLFFKLAVT